MEITERVDGKRGIRWWFAIPGLVAAGLVAWWLVSSLIVNHPPLGAADEYTVPMNAVFEVDAAEGVLANDEDPDDDLLGVQLAAGASAGSLTLDADGGFTYRPDRDFIGQDGFGYRASDGDKLSDEIRVTFDVVGPPPTADFGWEIDSGSKGDVPLTVRFIDWSSGSPRSWRWTFGDGGESAEQDPTYTYREPTYRYTSASPEGSLCFAVGTPFSVTLVVENDGGTDSISKTLKVKPMIHALDIRAEPDTLTSALRVVLAADPAHSTVCASGPTEPGTNGVYEYCEGQEVGLRAPVTVEYQGVTWTFDHWSGPGILDEGPLPSGEHLARLTIANDVTVTAHYTP